jgi:hypothetical protein
MMTSSTPPHGTPMSCPDCRAPYTASDNYCSQCGMYVAALRTVPVAGTGPVALVTVNVKPAAVTRSRPTLPALPVPVKRTATALAIGGALQIGLGVATRMMAGQTARRAAQHALVSAATNRRTPARREAPAKPVDATAIAPTDTGPTLVDELVVVRRVWMRRG